MGKIIEIQNLRYEAGGRTIADVDHLSVEAGEHVLLLGASGSGKTTLLHLVAGLLDVSGGNIKFDGNDFSGLPVADRDRIRGKSVGFVFQGNHLVRHLNVLQNVALVSDDVPRISRLLETLDLKGKECRIAASLSFGEAQRVGIARAVAHSPKLILADEPTSALDDENAKIVIGLLRAQAREAGAALIVSTHDARIKSGFDRVIVMRDGKAVTA